ncbi:hypothetical protein R3P38DRAFT_3191480 [Favolaschia claudopus]|uniref:Uncharacterized protein n=1 Tax=Favolaschia claudopus TaxID=2862362 RepID=A0AAV9ZQQ6_9AGAR
MKKVDTENTETDANEADLPEKNDIPQNGPGDTNSHDDDDDDSEFGDNDDSPFLNDLVELEDPSLQDDNQEIGVSVNGQGRLVPLSSQLADYQMRGTELTDTCVWDFISQIDKVKKSRDRRRNNEENEEYVDGNDDDPEDVDDENMVDEDAAEDNVVFHD